ncbi:MAG: hypothetical protein C4537_01945 [Acholeplasma sp.]|jgi:endonuclease/exonuclease/phosphatase family metal-dependent hydrolase|nr:MAG: hypothetical protein C4537_01945 [Acholeplasma sp.]
MHIASINLRIDVTVDGIHQWIYRRKAMMEFILKEEFDVIGMQEAGPGMFHDLISGLGDHYQIIYQGRDERGEGTPVAIKKDLPILKQGTLWLTDTKEVESTIPGSHFPRIVTFVHIGGSTPFYFFNTHLDYASDDICKTQALHLLKIIKQVNQEHLPYVITGDFNQYPDSMTIKTLKKSHQSIYDSMNGYPLTFHGFSDKKEGLPIDYIFLSDQWLIKNSMVHHHKNQGIYLSDHYPISIQITKK